jgi:hypothetical protein
MNTWNNERGNHKVIHRNFGYKRKEVNLVIHLALDLSMFMNGSSPASGVVAGGKVVCLVGLVGSARGVGSVGAEGVPRGRAAGGEAGMEGATGGDGAVGVDGAVGAEDAGGVVGPCARDKRDGEHPRRR